MATLTLTKKGKYICPSCSGDNRGAKYTAVWNKKRDGFYCPVCGQCHYKEVVAKRSGVPVVELMLNVLEG